MTEPKKSPTIIIIGAGIAGLSAANVLSNHNCNIQILEARDRIGGRTFTDYTSDVPFDLGAFVIHGNIDNPITQEAKNHHAPYQAITINSVYFANSAHQYTEAQMAAINAQCDKLFHDASKNARTLEHDISMLAAINLIADLNHYQPLDKLTLAWRLFFLTLYSGAEINDLSGQQYDAEEYFFEGGNHLMMNGYYPIVSGLAKNIPIKFNTEVTSINYKNEAIILTTNNETYTADIVLVTVPLGVLQNESIKFNPPLTAAKQEALSHLKMGVLNKVLLRFPSVFWPNEEVISLLTQQYTSASWFINFNKFFNEPVLLAVLGADMAKDFEKFTNEEACTNIMKILQNLFGPNIPKPIDFKMTRWSSDPYAFGSYSYVPIEATGEDYDKLAEPINQQIFFAGEATNRHYPSTVHGAYMSGIREANRILASLGSE